MNLAPGIVTSADAGSVTISFDPSVGCQACASGVGCGFGPLLRLFVGTRPQSIRLSNRAASQLRVGDRVSVAISAGTLAALAARAYGLPLSGIVAGAAAGVAVIPGGGDVAGISGALIGGALAWLAIRRRSAMATALTSRISVVR
jgi:positive regulator of sigma E activity